MSRTWVAIFALVATIAVSASAARAATRYDGTLPIYPHGVVAGEALANPTQFNQALKMGFDLFVDTSDAPAVVVGWYRAHLPGSFVMLPSGTIGTHFKNGNRVVNVIRYQWKTRIILSPG